MSILSLNAAVLCLQLKAPRRDIRLRVREHCFLLHIRDQNAHEVGRLRSLTAHWSTPSDAADGFITISGIVMYCADCRTVIIRVLRSLRVIRILRLC